MEVSEWEGLLAREGLSKWLPYFIEEEGIFFLKDGGVGFGFLCDPLLGGDQALEKKLESLYNLIPEGAVLQVSLWAFPFIEPAVREWKRSKVAGIRGDLEREIVENYEKFLLEKRDEKISKTFGVTLKDYKVIIAIKLGGKEKEFKIFDFFRKKEEKEERERIEDLVKRAKDLKGEFSALLSGVGFGSVVPLDGTVLASFLYRVINYPEEPPFDKVEGDISSAVVSYETTVEVHKEYIKLGNLYGTNLSAKALPEQWALFQAYEYIGKETQVYSSTPANPFVVYMNAIKLDRGARNKVLNRATIILNQRLPYSLVPQLARKQRDAEYGLDQISKGKDVWHVTFGVYVFGKDPKQLRDSTVQIKTYFKTLGFQLERDSYINFPVFLTVLPFGHDLRTVDFLKRGQAVFLENVVSLSPVFGDWKGTYPQIILMTPRGQLVGFDFFTSPGGYNSFVVGRTRSGKSVFLQLVALSYVLSGNNVWIIDIGRSYERLCHMLGGEFIEIKLDEPICLNPFSQIEGWDELEEYLEFLVDFVYMLGAPKDRKLSDEIEKLLKGYIDEAIKESYTRYGRESCIDTVAEILLELHGSDTRVRDFVTAMHRYTSKGTFGRFFNGESHLTFKGPITVFENDTVENIPDLRDPVMMQVIFAVSRNVYLSHDLSKRHLVIIDEAHKFLGNPKIDIFVEQAYRRMAKHGAGMIVGTQGFEDLYGGEERSRVGRVIVQNSFWKFFFTQTDTSRTALKNSGFFDFSDYGWELMNSVHVTPGEYSECFLLAEGFYTKLRVVLDPFLKAMFFTDDRTRKRIYELVRQGKSWTEAVRIVSGEKK